MFAHVLLDLRLYWDYIVQVFFDLFSRERTQSRIIRPLPRAALTLQPEIKQVGSLEVITLFSYDDERVAATIRALKYENSRYAAHLLANALERWLFTNTLQSSTLSERLIVVPIPLHEKRMRERGFNQITRVLTRVNPHAYYRSSIQFNPDILSREKYTEQQTKLSVNARKDNVAGAFRSHGIVVGRRIIIVDDVITTGATMLEAARVLRDAGASVTCLVFARA